MLTIRGRTMRKKAAVKLVLTLALCVAFMWMTAPFVRRVCS
jgi:hypothetical protein